MMDKHGACILFVLAASIFVMAFAFKQLSGSCEDETLTCDYQLKKDFKLASTSMYLVSGALAVAVSLYLLYMYKNQMGIDNYSASTGLVDSFEYGRSFGF
jgi:hypothetical protein